MKTKQISVLMMLLAVVITGCSPFRATKTALDHSAATSQGTPSASTYSTGKAETLPSSSPSAVPSPVALPFEQIQGDIRNIYYSDENQVFLSADQLVLVNLRTGQVAAEAPREAFNQQLIWTTKEGYVAVGVKITTGNSSSGWLTTGGEFAFGAVFYDHQLKQLTTFDFQSLLKENERISFLKAIAISSDGTQAAYATNTGLYLYNFETKKQSTVVDLETEDATTQSRIVAFEQVGFTNEDKTLAFKAKSLGIPAAPGKPSFDTGGTVNLDGSDLSNQTFDNYTFKELTTYEHRLLLAEDITVPSGRLLVMDIPSGKTNILTLTEKGESGFVTGSDKGHYFTTTLANNDRSGWKIRVYDTDTGKLQAEQYISSDGEARYMANDPIVRVFDDARTYIVLLGAGQLDIKPKVVTDRF